MASFRKRGNKWRAEVYVNGERASKTFDRKHLAVEWAAQYESRAQQLTPDRSTIQDLVEKYIDEVTVNHKGKKQEELRLRRIAAYFPDKPVVKIDKDAFSQWKIDLLKEVKPGTVRRYMTALSAVFSHAVNEWGYLSKNPLKGIKKPSDAPHRERAPSQAEVKLLLNQLGYSKGLETVETKNQEVAVSLLLAIESAMRAGEILSINKKNTNLTKRVVTLVDTKNKDSRKVPLSKEAVRLIKQLPNRRFTVSSPVHSQLFRKAVKSAGIEDLRFHDSRAAGLMKLSKKVDVLTLARIVGHRSPASLMIYYRETAEDIAKLLD